MNTRKTTLIAVAILLFAIGAWPIAIAVLIFAILTPPAKEKNDKERIKELEKEVRDLHRKMDEQFVEKIIRETDGKNHNL